VDGREEPLVKRAGVTLMASRAVAEERADDALFAAFLRPPAHGPEDDRPLVRKGPSQALRAIGKRGPATTTTETLRTTGHPG
jgi:hypothetical protein